MCKLLGCLEDPDEFFKLNLICDVLRLILMVRVPFNWILGDIIWTHKMGHQCGAKCGRFVTYHGACQVGFKLGGFPSWHCPLFDVGPCCSWQEWITIYDKYILIRYLVAGPKSMLKIRNFAQMAWNIEKSEVLSKVYFGYICHAFKENWKQPSATWTYSPSLRFPELILPHTVFYVVK